MEYSVQESYDKIAKDFSVTRVFKWKWTNDFIDKNVSNHTNNLINLLDLGCGNARNMEYLYKNLICHGIDISYEQLKNGKNKNLVQSNFCNIPFKNNYFDIIISIASFHHLDNINDRKIALKEMQRILSKNGKILLSVWSKCQPKKTRRIFNNYGDTIVYFKDIPRYYYIFKIQEIKELIEEFFIIDKYYWDCGNEIFELSQKNHLNNLVS